MHTVSRILLSVFLFAQSLAIASDEERYVNFIATQSLCAEKYEDRSICECVGRMNYSVFNDIERAYVSIVIDLYETDTDKDAIDEYMNQLLWDEEVEKKALVQKLQDLKPLLEEQCNYK